MRVYVIGAGVSKSADYPLGGELLGALIKHVDESHGPHKEQWAELLDWLENNANPDVRQAYAQEWLEHIFTILDLTVRLQDNASTNAKHRLGFLKETKSVPRHRGLLLRVLADYFGFRHLTDRHTQVDRWTLLDKFGKRMRTGDFLITFNYDALMERVLFQQDKWFPTDGYGFRVPLHASINDATPVSEESKVTLLKLHGSIGWYPANQASPDNGGSEGGETTRSSKLGSEQRLNVERQLPIVLGQDFLHNLHITAFDSRCDWDTTHGPQVLIHPSFLKNFESSAFSALWRRAAEALRNADEVAVVAYSLPAEDSAALTLLQTNCDPEKVTIVNNSTADCQRLRHLLAGAAGSDQCLSFEEWLDEALES